MTLYRFDMLGVMKRRCAVVALGLFLVAGVQAQSTGVYERKDFSIKLSKDKDTDGLYRVVRLVVSAGNKLVKEYRYELPEAMGEDMVEAVSVTEQDLNFDGYPDVDVYLGYVGGFSNNTRHEALLWDQKQHCFVRAQGYNEIGEPQVDAEAKCITTAMSAGPDERVVTYYRWDGAVLKEYLSNTWKMDDEEVVNYSDMLNLPFYSIDAKLDGRVSVVIAFQKNTDGIVAGYIYYPKAKNPAPIMIAGTVSRDGSGEYYLLNEYQADGSVSGIINLSGSVDEGRLEGAWVNPKTQKQMKIAEPYISHEAVKWFNKSLLVPEDPSNIGKSYAFQQWNESYKSIMGGQISFKAAGKNKVHFDCGNTAHNIALGKSAAGRPAVLRGNVFEYNNVNECGYGFRATFFPRFVVLTTTSAPATLKCFGMGASFDGIYVKVKQ